MFVFYHRMLRVLYTKLQNYTPHKVHSTPSHCIAVRAHSEFSRKIRWSWELKQASSANTQEGTWRFACWCRKIAGKSVRDFLSTPMLPHCHTAATAVTWLYNTHTKTTVQSRFFFTLFHTPHSNNNKRQSAHFPLFSLAHCIFSDSTI